MVINYVSNTFAVLSDKYVVKYINISIKLNCIDILFLLFYFIMCLKKKFKTSFFL